MIVVDCSALIAFLTDSGRRGQQARSRIAQETRLHAPHLIDTEIASALLGLARGTRGGVPKVTASELDEHFKTYAALPIHRREAAPLLPRVRVLHANLSAYDATYVALAEMLGVPLITADARIKKGLTKPNGGSMAHCEIDVLGAAEP
ncbi:PIN domain-containing protein [Streptomyces glaucosporus]|uniref:PIN domain-containing protein n=1 Tax=Streptomyces glaucosporus TaxID=284044 RepID=A0ABN3HP42_9ACTN